MPKPTSVVQLRVGVSLQMFERIAEYRHLGRHNSKNEALVCLIAAGLVALSKPVELPSVSASNTTLASDLAPARPSRAKPQLVGFAGREDNPHGGRPRNGSPADA